MMGREPWRKRYAEELLLTILILLILFCFLVTLK